MLGCKMLKRRTEETVDTGTALPSRAQPLKAAMGPMPLAFAPGGFLAQLRTDSAVVGPTAVVCGGSESFAAWSLDSGAPLLSAPPANALPESRKLPVRTREPGDAVGRDRRAAVPHGAASLQLLLGRQRDAAVGGVGAGRCQQLGDDRRRRCPGVGQRDEARRRGRL